MKKFSKYFDHTLLKPDATSEDIRRLCREAAEYDFYSVCVNSCNVKTAKDELALLCPDDPDRIKVTSVVGFPLGAMSSDAKGYETTMACEDGASEIDMVINIGALKEKNYELVTDDILTVVSIADEYDADVKVILETGILSEDEIKKACELAVRAGAAFVKTSTGFGYGGAKESDIRLMRSCILNHAKIKASGGIRNLAAAQKMIDAGADRIGASASVDIMKEYSNL